MALHQTTLESRAVSIREIGRVLLVIGTAIVLMLVATVIFGVNEPGPSYELTTDPAGVLPF